MTAIAAPAAATRHVTRKVEEIEPLVGDSVSSKSGKDLQNVMKRAQKISVSLDSVYISKAENIRDLKGYTEDDITQMAMQIEAVGGITNPIQIAKIPKSPTTENKPYILVVGFRRCLGLLYLADSDPAWKNDVPAHLLNDANTLGATRVVQLLENMARRDLNAMEIAVAVKDALEDKESDYSQKDMARLLGRSEANISQLLKLNKLPQTAQDMISTGKLPWTHARILVSNRDIPESAYADLAMKGCDCLLEDFQDLIDEKYGSQEAADGEDAAGTGGAGSTQKPAKMLRATEVENIFVPFLEERLKEADEKEKKYSAKDLATVRLDAVKTILKNQETTLAKDIAPYQEQRKKSAEAEEQQKKSKDNEAKFFRSLVKRVEEILKTPVDPAKPNESRPTLSSAYGVVAKEVTAMTEEKRKEAGFDFAAFKEPKVLVEKIATTYAEVRAAREKATAERKKREAEEKATEKAAEDAKAKAVPASAV